MRLLYVTSLSGKRINGFMRSAIIAAKQLGIDFTMACNTDMADKDGYREDCQEYGIEVKHVDFNRNPLSLKNRKAKEQLLKIIKVGNYDIVHCNTPIGGILGRLCAHKEKVNHIIYQAHGFHFWHGAPLINWLLYYPVELFLSRYTDILVTITRDDYELSKRMHSKECRYVHGVGVDLNQFVIRDRLDRNNELRERLNIPYNAKVLLSVGELNANKNHGRVIRAIASLQDKNIHYVICGEGELKTEYEKLGQDLGLGQRLHLMGFCADVADYYRMADLFVFPSLREGIPASIMEAMAIGVPVVASDVRGIKDIVQDPTTRFDPSDQKQIASIIAKTLKEDNARRIAKNLQILKPYEFNMVVDELKALYKSTME